jgi:hypothetical protein
VASTRRLQLTTPIALLPEPGKTELKVAARVFSAGPCRSAQCVEVWPGWHWIAWQTCPPQTGDSGRSSSSRGSDHFPWQQQRRRRWQQWWLQQWWRQQQQWQQRRPATKQQRSSSSSRTTCLCSSGGAHLCKSVLSAQVKLSRIIAAPSMRIVTQ